MDMDLERKHGASGTFKHNLYFQSLATHLSIKVKIFLSLVISLLSEFCYPVHPSLGTKKSTWGSRVMEMQVGHSPQPPILLRGSKTELLPCWRERSSS